MKKNKFFGLGLISTLSASFLISACGTGTVTPKELPLDYDPNYNYEEVIKENIHKSQDEIETPIKQGYRKIDTTEAINPSDYSVQHKANGLDVVRSYHRREIGYFNSITGRFIVNVSLYEDWLTNEKFHTEFEDRIFFVSYDYNNKSYVYDSNGNTIYEGDVLENVVIEEHYNHALNKYEYTLNFGQKDFYYDNGNIKVGKPTPIVEEEKEEINPYVINLAEYGLENAELHFKDGYFVLDVEGAEKTFDFYISEECTVFLVGTNIYYQTLYSLPENAQEFDFYADDVKYNLTTRKVDLVAQKISEVDFGYLFDSNYSPIIKDNVYKLAYVELSRINNYQSLEAPSTYLVDQNLKTLYNFKSMEPQAFIKTDEGYYNTKTKILYDNNLDVIAYLDKFSDIDYNEDLDLFIARKNSYYGAFNTSGKIKLQFEYDRIITNPDSKRAILKKDNKYYLTSEDYFSSYGSYGSYDLTELGNNMNNIPVSSGSPLYWSYNAENFYIYDFDSGIIYQDQSSSIPNLMDTKTYNRTNGDTIVKLKFGITEINGSYVNREILLKAVKEGTDKYESHGESYFVDLYGKDSFDLANGTSLEKDEVKVYRILSADRISGTYRVEGCEVILYNAEESSAVTYKEGERFNAGINKNYFVVIKNVTGHAIDSLNVTYTNNF